MATAVPSAGTLQHFLCNRIWIVWSDAEYGQKTKKWRLTPVQAQQWLERMPAFDREVLEDSPLFELLEQVYSGLDEDWLPPEQKVHAVAALKAFRKAHPAKIAQAMTAAVVLSCWLEIWMSESRSSHYENANALRSTTGLLGFPRWAENRWTTAILSHVRSKLLHYPIEPTIGQFHVLSQPPENSPHREFLGIYGPALARVVAALSAEDLSAPADQQLLRTARAALEMCGWCNGHREECNLLDQRLGDELQSPLPSGEPWADFVNSTLASQPVQQRGEWIRLLRHLGTVGFNKPNKAWAELLMPLIASFDRQALTEITGRWLQQILDTPPLLWNPTATLEEMDRPDYRRRAQEAARSAPFKFGTIGLVGALASPESAAHLAKFIEQVAQLKANHRTQLTMHGSAAIRVLSAMPEPSVPAQLSRLSLRVRWPKFKKLIAKEFDKLVANKGLDRREVEEASVPDFDLHDGVTTLAFGDFRATLTLGRSEKPSVSWTADDGKVSRVMPKALKETHPTAAATVKQTAAEIEAMLTAQRTRLDLLMRRDRAWPIDLWRQRYLNHGLIGTLARRLIWTIDNVAVIWRDGQLVDRAGSPVSPSPTSTVKLWHPAQQPAADVLAWRQTLVDWNITQPFKQAYREIYILTDAELRTNTYSNRFAAHIVKGPTLLAITQARHWKSGTHGGTSSPCCEWPDLPVWADWWLEAAGTEYTPYGAPLYLATDQVRFRRRNDPPTAPLPLSEVPALIFSETLRDIDLFVGVASVGNDPNWTDGSGRERYHAYWHNYSFGDLSETAKTRRAVLTNLLPRMTKLRDRWSLDDKFLVIRGQLRTYKIHLGSGNILMTPNDQYLCIVPDRSTHDGDERLFLPFEGDTILSVILSKALMLADDAAIKDPSIVSQIGRQ